MEYKYGHYPSEQFNKYKKRLHSLVHWLLIYAEEKNPILDNYFTKVQCKLDGLNELIEHPSQMVEIMNLIESARIVYNSPTYDYEIYRKIILEIHDLIDMLPDGE